MGGSLGIIGQPSLLGRFQTCKRPFSENKPDKIRKMSLKKQYFTLTFGLDTHTHTCIHVHTWCLMYWLQISLCYLLSAMSGTLLLMLSDDFY